ncbi:MAG TPA: flagellar protein FliT [Burkholderiales bacterium]|nr:flagellar protein FliT [Burkholderiales bacterium]
MNEQQTLEAYQKIHGIVERMAAAARRDEWDTVIALEHECRQQVDRLTAHQPPPAADAVANRRKAALIREILDYDAEIRRLAEPRLANLEAMLEVIGNQRLLKRAYGATTPNP